jgi:hypothetical protein
MSKKIGIPARVTLGGLFKSTFYNTSLQSMLFEQASHSRPLQF